MIELCRLDIRHFVIEVCGHLVNGCTTKCGYIGLVLFRYLSYRLGAIICDIITIGFVSVYACGVCDALVASCATVQNATPLSMKQSGCPMLKRRNDSAHTY